MSRLLRVCAMRHLWLAAALAGLVAIAGAMYGARVAGGSDSYGYVSQADLWLGGSLVVSQDFVADAPWPDARWTFVPLGFRPVPDGYAIVPQYAPGLPLLMAGAKLVGGQAAVFLVVPLLAGVFVFATYAIGRGLGRPVVGLVAAWLVGTSPLVLHRAMWPMSDVPVAACWALAIAWSLRNTRASATLAGIAAAVAITIRPNLVPLAGILTGWVAWTDTTGAQSRTPRTWRWPWFATCAALGAVFIAAFNQRLYGSPFESGYVGVADLFSRANVLENLRRYVGWLVESETPVVLLGLVAIVLPLRSLWPTASAARHRWWLAAIVVAIWGSYLPYEPFDSWWYLRFLLPGWPMMALGAASLVALLTHGGRLWRGTAAVAILLGAGGAGILHAARTDAFAVQRGEYKYAHVAQAVRAMTPHDAVILSQQHSGSLRYYGGRMTMRWDAIDGEWLDRAVEWLTATGHHPFLLLEREEVERMKGRYGEVSQVGRLNWTPVASMWNGSILLFDAETRTASVSTVAVPEPDETGGAPAPAAAPRFRK